MDLLSIKVFAMVILIGSQFNLDSLLSETAGTTTLNYVTPNAETGCPQDGGNASCFTLKEYTDQQDVYFTNNSTFFILPGMHQLDGNLQLISVHGLTIQGMQGNGLVRIALTSSATITWKNCLNIEILYISFVLLDKFTFAIVFENTRSIRMFNTSILGDGSRGCSSILSQNSTLNVMNSKFVGINGAFGAAMKVIDSSNVEFTGSNIFESNTAMLGGALYFEDSVIMINASGSGVNFTNNSVMNFDNICEVVTETQHISSGGALYSDSSVVTLIGKSMVIFADNMAKDNGTGGAIAIKRGSFNIQASVLFYKNYANLCGGAILLEDALISNVFGFEFINTAIEVGDALIIPRKTILFNMNHTINDNSLFNLTFEQNTAEYRGGAIASDDSLLAFTKTILFEGNSVGSNGGAISLTESGLILVPSLNMSFIKNHANETGGALYVEDPDIIGFLGLLIKKECFISVFSNHTSTRNIHLHFEYNSAGSTGSTLFGGDIRECTLYFRTSYDLDTWGNENLTKYSSDLLGVFMNMSDIVHTGNTKNNSNISSSAKGVELCQSQGNSLAHKLNVHPGKQFNVTLGVLDMIGSPIQVPKILLSIMENEDNSEQPYTYVLGKDYRVSPLSQHLGENHYGSCSNANFRLYSTTTGINVSFTLIYTYHETQHQKYGQQIDFYLHIQPCPIGFEMSTKDVDNDHKCVCHRRLQKFIQNCYIDFMSFERMRNSFWISSINDTELVIHDSRCPLDYCTDDPINVTLALSESDVDVQCDLNRDGILCGQCKKNFSLALGSLHCRSCSNNHIALIVFFAAAGVALVALIFLCRLTVSNGTLNGLLFYSNIIQANFQAFFPRDTMNFCTVFISWLNLDFGIGTCFYDGMDIYAYSWFQFLFPIYIVVLVGSIVLGCRYSQSVARRFGKNPVAVLATLLLMSFSKILQAIIVPLSSTLLTYYNSYQDSESHQTVWLYDGSIGFFKETKHIALGLFALMSLVVFVLPYIFLLFFGHWLQGCSNWWILSWLNKIKPFMDAYHAPYTEQARYWTGLLLLTRLGLFLTFAINAGGSESINILAVSVVSLVLLSFKRRVYEHGWKDLLESSFLLNLGIFSVVTFYLKEESEDANSQLIFSRISVGLAFITFIGILIFHLSLVIKSSNIWKLHMLPLMQSSFLLGKLFRIKPAVKDKPKTLQNKDTTELCAVPMVTSTEIDVDLREPLIEITESHATSHAN